MDVYTKKGGLKKLMKDFTKEQIAKLYIAELKKNKELNFNSTLINSSASANSPSTHECNAESNIGLENIDSNEEKVDDFSVITSAPENVVLQTSFSQEVQHKSYPEQCNDIGTFIDENNTVDNFVDEQGNRNVDDNITNNIFQEAETNRELNERPPLPVIPENTEVNRQPINNEEYPPLPVLSEYTDMLSNLKERIFNLEKKCAANDQYSRRNNVEIAGIPDSLPDDLLEDKVIEILNYLNISLVNWDIEACHRLKKSLNSPSPARVIVRFVNRKNTLLALTRRKSLKDVNLKSDGNNYTNNKVFINENLCPSYRVIYDFAYRLLKNNVISHLWSYKGVVHLKVGSQNYNDNVLSFTHIDDIKSYFM